MKWEESGANRRSRARSDRQHQPRADGNGCWRAYLCWLWYARRDSLLLGSKTRTPPPHFHQPPDSSPPTSQRMVRLRTLCPRPSARNSSAVGGGPTRITCLRSTALLRMAKNRRSLSQPEANPRLEGRCRVRIRQDDCQDRTKRPTLPRQLLYAHLQRERRPSLGRVPPPRSPPELRRCLYAYGAELITTTKVCV